MKIIAGLGNPGKEYEHTRHNMGFDVIDILADRWKVASWKKDMKADIATVIEHVLQRPYGEDIELIEAAKIHTADSIEDALAHGVDHAMNAFNPKKKK